MCKEVSFRREEDGRRDDPIFRLVQSVLDLSENGRKVSLLVDELVHEECVDELSKIRLLEEVNILLTHLKASIRHSMDLCKMIYGNGEDVAKVEIELLGVSEEVERTDSKISMFGIPKTSADTRN